MNVTQLLGWRKSRFSRPYVTYEVWQEIERYKATSNYQQLSRERHVRVSRSMPLNAPSSGLTSIVRIINTFY